MSASAAPVVQAPTAANWPFVPIFVRTATTHRPIGPTAFDCVTLIFVRSGSAILMSEFGERPVSVGDVVALGANTLNRTGFGGGS